MDYSKEVKAILSPVEAKRRYDNAAKNILMLPWIFALIPHKTEPDRFGPSLQGLVNRFRKSLRIPGNDNVEGLKDDLTEIVKAEAEFDALTLCVLESEDSDTLVVEVEVQNSFPGLKTLVGRMYFYTGVLTVSQKNDLSGFASDHYGNLKPVYSLWILPNMVHSWITDITTQTETLYTDSEEYPLPMALKETADRFIHVQVASIGKNWMKCGNEAIECLGHIFHDSANPEQQIRYLEKEGVPVTAKTYDAFDEFNEAQSIWTDLYMKSLYDQMKSQRDTYKNERDIYKNERDTYKNERDIYKDERDTYKKECGVYKDGFNTYKGKYDSVEQWLKTDYPEIYEKWPKGEDHLPADDISDSDPGKFRA